MNLVLVEEMWKLNFSYILSNTAVGNNFIGYFPFGGICNIHLQRFNYEQTEIYKI